MWTEGSWRARVYGLVDQLALILMGNHWKILNTRVICSDLNFKRITLLLYWENKEWVRFEFIAVVQKRIGGCLDGGDSRIWRKKDESEMSPRCYTRRVSLNRRRSGLSHGELLHLGGVSREWAVPKDKEAKVHQNEDKLNCIKWHQLGKMNTENWAVNLAMWMSLVTWQSHFGPVEMTKVSLEQVQ